MQIQTMEQFSAIPVPPPATSKLNSVMEHVDAAPPGTVVPIVTPAPGSSLTATALLQTIGFGLSVDDPSKLKDIAVRIGSSEIAGRTAKAAEDVADISELLTIAHPGWSPQLNEPITLLAMAGNGLQFMRARTPFDKAIYGAQFIANAVDAGATLLEAVRHLDVRGAHKFVLAVKIGAKIIAVYRDLTTSGDV